MDDHVPRAGAASVLVTGGNGFVGSAQRQALSHHGADVLGAVRRTPPPAGCFAGPSLGPDADWSALLRGRQVVIHTAARVHVMRETAAHAERAYQQVNVDGTVALVRQAAHAGVRRFVFLSTVKVHGEDTAPGRPFQASDPLRPQDDYARSKAHAEQALIDAAQAAGMEWVIVRPPLVHGPGVGGNMARLLAALRAGRPLPFGRLTDNRRSLAGLDNLVDLLVRCVDHPAAAGRAFLVSDGQDVSTADLLQRLGAAIGQPARLWPLPVVFLKALGRMPGAGGLRRLTGNLQVDVHATCQTLQWQPPISLDEGLRRMAQGRAA